MLGTWWSYLVVGPDSNLQNSLYDNVRPSPTRPETVLGRVAPVSPRPNASAQEILETTIHLIAKHGVSGVTVDAVALTAGVSKATIYRRWRSRTNLIRDAIAGLHRLSLDPDTGSLRDDLDILLRDLVKFLNRPEGGQVYPSFVEAASRDPELAALSQEIERGVRSAYERVIRHAVQRGELPPAVDVRLLIDLLTAPFIYRRIIDHTRVRASDIGRLLDAVLPGFERVQT